MSAWTAEEIAALVEAYAAPALRLDEIADRLGRLKSNVSRKARALGLTRANRPKSDYLKRAVSASTRAYIRANGHPRGALGMKHTASALQKITAASQRAAAATSPEEKRRQVEQQMRTKVDRGNSVPPRHGATWKSGWREIGGARKFYRSRWEANYARYLQWLLERGEIRAWEHEPKTFWFEGIRRGCVSYLPDFCVTERGGAEVYHEVKGWMDDRSKTKIKRMRKYHPGVALVVIDTTAYRKLEKQISALVPGWES